MSTVLEGNGKLLAATKQSVFLPLVLILWSLEQSIYEELWLAFTSEGYHSRGSQKPKLINWILL
jgi:hypothetical protein